MTEEEYAKKQLAEAREREDMTRGSRGILQDIRGELEKMNAQLEVNTQLIRDLLALFLAQGPAK